MQAGAQSAEGGGEASDEGHASKQVAGGEGRGAGKPVPLDSAAKPLLRLPSRQNSAQWRPPGAPPGPPSPVLKLARCRVSGRHGVELGGARDGGEGLVRGTSPGERVK